MCLAQRPGVRPYAALVLPALRDQRGRPAGPLRVLAALVALGLMALAAPAVVPIVRWLLSAVL